ncbi:MAG TPA: hypothetical protein VMU95_02805 [Trebonia sp.]|nr:hypothetical protein [Trebonia sp.]
MLQLAFDVAQWLIWVAGAVAVAALLLIAWRAVRPPRRFSIGSAVALIVAAGVCLASFLFLGTRVQQVTIGTITQLGLERNHAGLRGNALIDSVPVTVTASWSPLPSYLGGGVIRYLDHKTMTVTAQVAVYGMIDFTTVSHKTATVNRQARTISLALPNPAVSKNTTYIWSVDNVQERTGLLPAVQQSLVGPFESLFGHSQVSFDINPELSRAETAALGKARTSAALASCDKEEITKQLNAEFNLLPAYAGYTVHVTWPQPPDPTISCAGLQSQLSKVNPAS